jgi:CubicO group peptidase (beta-lactamase class C family)
VIERLTAALLLIASTFGGAAQASGPVFSDTGPDAAAYGAGAGYPIGARMAAPLPQSIMVGTYSHWSDKYPSRTVGKPDTASPFTRAADELALSYTYRGQQHDLTDYLSRHPATGLLIARDNTILFEHYQYARTDHDPMLSQSMAKTIVAMLVGIAVQDGAIHSIDQPAAVYVPELTGTEYGKTPIRALLHMASGVAFREEYDTPGTDNARLGEMLSRRGGPGPARAVAMFNTRETPPDTRFHYAGAETEILGLVLSAATKTHLADYLKARIWQPMGAEADATWTVDHTGQEVAYCCVSAVVRDWARIGSLLAQDGAWKGRQIVPKQWVLDMTTAQSDFQRPGIATNYYGYGYQVWLFPGPRRRFALLGIHGQAIFVDPGARVVLVHTAVRLKASRDPTAAELVALWDALIRKFSD